MIIWQGYLDNFERVVRKYDANGDGVFDVNEVKNIVTDLHRSEAKTTQWKRMAATLAGVVLVLASERIVFFYVREIT